MGTSDANPSADGVADGFKRIETLLKRAKQLNHHIKSLLEILVDKSQEFKDIIDGLTTSTANTKQKVQDHDAALQQTIDDLNAKINTGSAGLTEEQANDVLTQLQGLKSNVEDIAAGIPDVTPPSGETNVPINP